MKQAAVTRKEAQARGLKAYYTGKPCPRGHVAERRVSNAVCAECHRQEALSTYHRRQAQSRERGLEALQKQAQALQTALQEALEKARQYMASIRSLSIAGGK